MPALNTAATGQAGSSIQNYIFTKDSLANHFNIAGPERIKAINGVGLVLGNSFKMPIIGIGAANERADVTTPVNVSAAAQSTKDFIINKEFYKDYAIDTKADSSVQALFNSSDYIEGIIVEITNKTNAYIYQNLLLNANINLNTNIVPANFTSTMIAGYKTKLTKARARYSDSCIILSHTDTNNLINIAEFKTATSILATRVVTSNTELNTLNLNGLKTLTYDYDQVLEGVLPSGNVAVDAILNNVGVAIFAGKNAVVGAVDKVNISTEDMLKTNGKAKLLYGSALAGFGVGLPQAFLQEVIV